MQKNIESKMMGGGTNATPPIKEKNKRNGNGNRGGNGNGSSEWWVLCCNGKVVVVTEPEKYSDCIELTSPFPSKDEAERWADEYYPNRKC